MGVYTLNWWETCTHVCVLRGKRNVLKDTDIIDKYRDVTMRTDKQKHQTKQTASQPANVSSWMFKRRHWKLNFSLRGFRENTFGINWRKMLSPTLWANHNCKLRKLMSNKAFKIKGRTLWLYLQKLEGKSIIYWCIGTNTIILHSSAV